MLMNKKDYAGLKKVFAFSFMQNLKSKMNIAVTVILCIICFLGVPVSQALTDSDEDKGSETAITDVYICDETGFELYESIENQTNEIYKDVKCHEEFVKPEDLKKLESKNSVYLDVKFDAASGFLLTGIYETRGKLTADSVDTYMEYLQDDFEKIVADAAGIDDEVIKSLNREIEIDVVTRGEKVEKTDNEDLSVQSSFIIFVMIFILAMCGENIATSIATEKTTRVIEYLMINIRPIALIVGKIMASILLVIIQIASAGICFGVSWILFNGSGHNSTAKMLESVIGTQTIGNISVAGCIVSIFIFIMGFLLFGLIAGLAGAAVSKIENIGEGMKLYSILLIVCAYAALFIPMFGEKNVFLELFPLTSIFMLPGELIFGGVKWWIVIVAVILLALSVLVMLAFVAGVYENMIFYNGETLKVREIIAMFKTKGRDK